MKINVKVHANASRNQIIGWENDLLKIHVTATPEKGKANKAVLKLLSKKLKVGNSQISIIKGFTSSHKIIVIEDMQKSELENRTK